MSTVAEGFALYQLELADVEGDRITPELYLFWLNEAYALVYNLRPDMFSRTYTMRLEPGVYQRPCACAKLLDVRDFADAAGAPVAAALKVKTGQDKFFSSTTSLAAAVCSASSATAVAGTPPYTGPTTYERSAFSPNEFYVTPAVPATGAFFANIVCSLPPDQLKGPESQCLEGIFYPAVRSYVKAMAYATESESTTSRQWFDTWMSSFFRILGLQKQVDDALFKRMKFSAPSSSSTSG